VSTIAATLVDVSTFGPHLVIERGDTDAPLVVLLHGRGSDANDIIALADHLPSTFGYAAVRAPIAEGGGYAWFANRGIGRPVGDSLAAALVWFRSWLDTIDRPIVLVGFSGGAAFAGALLLTEPARFAGTAILLGTLPFDAGIPTEAGRLAGSSVFLALGDHDTVIPADLQERTWTYLHEASGATLTARRDPIEHEIHPATIAALAEWLVAIEVPT
jgi:phospholipase/carboxylesterase